MLHLFYERAVFIAAEVCSVNKEDICWCAPDLTVRSWRILKAAERY